MKRFSTLFLFGPTCSGKSDIAITIATDLDAVIINADSMQVYRGLEKMTASPTKDQWLRAPHALYNFVDPEVNFNVNIWHGLAIKKIRSILQTAKRVVICGGTGLYATVMLNGLAQVPDVDPKVRAHVRKEREYFSKRQFYAILCQEDSLMARRLDPEDSQRIARALEVFRTTGKSLLFFQKSTLRVASNPRNIGLITLVPDRSMVYRSIEKRFDNIVAQGGIDEVKALKEKKIPATMPACKAIGVRQILAYINGTLTLQDAILEAKTATRRYAKRQYTYMKHQLVADFTITCAQDVPALLLALKKSI